MPKKSAGLVMYRFRASSLEVLLVHPGGPFWRNKDTAAWSIPKGEYAEGEDPFQVALREFKEETGFDASGDFLPLGEYKQPGGKRVIAWAFAGDCDPDRIHSNTFTMEWPPKSGKMAEFPEVDRAGWFDLDTAEEKIHKGQRGIIEALRALAFRK